VGYFLKKKGGKVKKSPFHSILDEKLQQKVEGVIGTLPVAVGENLEPSTPVPASLSSKTAAPSELEFSLLWKLKRKLFRNLCYRNLKKIEKLYFYI
jgi:hypothetical protein